MVKFVLWIFKSFREEIFADLAVSQNFLVEFGGLVDKISSCTTCGK